MVYLLLIPAFVLSYLAGRLTEAMGCLVAALLVPVAIFVLFLLSPYNSRDGWLFLSGGADIMTNFVGLLGLLIFASATALIVMVGVGGYYLGQRHRLPPSN